MALGILSLGIGLSHDSQPPILDQYVNNTVSVTSDGGYCSGWVKKETHEVVTAAHCADGLDNTAVFNVDFGDGTQHPFHIRRKGDEQLVQAPDLMTLYTNDVTIKWPVGFEVCQFQPYYGEDLVLIGGPLEISKSLEFGKVANPDVNVTESLTPDAKYGMHLIEFNGEMWPGNSGGPAVDLKEGCVMGSGELAKLVSDGMTYYPMGVNFLTPMGDLNKMDTKS